MTVDVVAAALVRDGRLLAARRSRPAPLEDHDELRWLSADEIDAVGWLPIDLTLLPAARQHLQERNQRGRL